MKKYWLFFKTKCIEIAHSAIYLIDSVIFVKALGYINLSILLLNAISYFITTALIVIHPSLHYWFFVFSVVVIIRYTQKNWDNI